MPATKQGVALAAAAALAVGATNQSAEQDISTAYGAEIVGRITNGATGPTAGCQALVEVRNSGTDAWLSYRTFQAGTVASQVYAFSFSIEPAIVRYRLTFSGHTGQAVTVEAAGHHLTVV